MNNCEVESDLVQILVGVRGDDGLHAFLSKAMSQNLLNV